MERETGAHDILERMLLDASADPTDLPLWLLKSITKDFSDDRKIGSGGFASVYKGILSNGTTVAVKRLDPAVDMDEKSFDREVTSLIRVKHNNVVRFLGYCGDTQVKVEKYKGKAVRAEMRQRLLCFEFMPNGGLDKYISDASRGLDWRTRYQILKGICKGLYYLHQQNIVHSDLKPGNILLDQHMVPKIADFGLAKCFDETQTRATTMDRSGSLGYMAPEFIYNGQITLKSDIFSLGVIINETLTGKRGYLEIENVLENWRSRFKTSKEGTWLEHVKLCAEISIECTDFNPVKRPMASHIMEMLDKIDRRYGFIEAGAYTSSATYADRQEDGNGNDDPDNMTYEQRQTFESVGTEDIGLSDEQISSLQWKYEEILEACAICLSNFRDQDTMITLPCRHYFHAGCVTKWLKAIKWCPICRQALGIPSI